MKGDDKLIKWSKNYLMGIDKLDEEIKNCFRISDQIYNKSNGEEMMRSTGYSL